MFKFLKNIIKPKSQEAHPEIKFKSEQEVDVDFTEKFVRNGGIFNYNESESEALENLQAIIKAESLENILCLDESLQGYLSPLSCTATQQPSEADALLMYCEGLIAFDGTIMISGDQIKNFKLYELPKHIIVWAYTNQLFRTSSEGMQRMRIVKKDRIPSNITCLRGFLDSGFNQENISKRIFLLLVEKI